MRYGATNIQQEQQHHHRAYPAFARKMNDTIDNPKYIKTVWGVGYKLKNKKNDYSKLERKLYMYIVAIVVVAIVFVLYIRSMIRGKLGIGS